MRVRWQISFDSSRVLSVRALSSCPARIGLLWAHLVMRSVWGLCVHASVAIYYEVMLKEAFNDRHPDDGADPTRTAICLKVFGMDPISVCGTPPSLIGWVVERDR